MVTGTNIVDHPITFIFGLTIGTLAALLPDIDSPHNTFRKSLGLNTSKAFRDLTRWRKRNFLQLTIDLIQIWIALILDFVDKFMPHRGPTHWGATAGFFTLGAYWFCTTFSLPDPLWIAFGVGYFSHLLGDGVTKQGVKFLAPAHDKFIRLLPKFLCVRTGSFGEKIMLSFLVSLILGWMFWMLIG